MLVLKTLLFLVAKDTLDASVREDAVIIGVLVKIVENSVILNVIPVYHVLITKIFMFISVILTLTI